MVVWEVSEQYSKWQTQCHIKLGVSGLEAQTFFNRLMHEAAILYTEFKKHKKAEVSPIPAVWDKKTRKLEVKLAAMLTSSVTPAVMHTAIAISQNFGQNKLEGFKGNPGYHPMSLIILYALLEHVKPGTNEVRKSLMKYLRSPPSTKDPQTALDEVI